MRTTIDLPDDLYELARQLAHERRRSISEVVAELMRLGLRPARSEPTTSRRGIPLVSVGHPVTSQDVRSLDDE